MAGTDGRDIRRVLHCFGGMDLGGAETFAMHVYRSLNRDEMQFDFAVSSEKNCAYDDEIRDLGGRIIAHTPPMKAGFKRFDRELTDILRNHGPFYAVHSHLHYFSGYILRTAAREKVPVRVAHFHSTRDARAGTLLGFAYHAVMLWLIKRFATRILACSENVFGTVFGPQWSRDRRMLVMRNGIDLTPYSILQYDRVEICRKFEIPVAGTVLGHIGNFSAAKNYRFLVELFKYYLQTDPSATLVLMGDGELRQETERQVQDCGLNSHVRFLGRRPQAEVPDLLAAINVLVMPSIYEGLPVTLVEAQSAGVPCVISESITKEADLGLGLLKFVNLRCSPDQWCEQITAALRNSRPEWTTRRNALQAAGYDRADSSSALSRVYQDPDSAAGVPNWGVTATQRTDR
jgi:glycosyltransferase EpsF